MRSMTAATRARPAATMTRSGQSAAGAGRPRAGSARRRAQSSNDPSSRAPAWHPAASHPAREQVTGVRYRLEVRLTPADIGQRVVIRWRGHPGDGEQIADVLGILEENDPASFAVRTSDGALVVIPAARNDLGLLFLVTLNAQGPSGSRRCP